MVLQLIACATKSAPRIAALALSLLAVVAGCGKLPGASTAVEPNELGVIGIADDIEELGSNVWFDVGQADVRFLFKSRNAQDAKDVLSALQDSAKSNRSINVRFDVARGYLDRESKQPKFLASKIQYDGRTVTSARDYYWGAPRKPSAAEEALARGVAFYTGQKFSQALTMLDKSLASNDLDEGMKRLAFKTRGLALSDQVETLQQAPNDAGDRQLVKALADKEEWARRDPESAAPLRAIALTLRQLGGYADARAVFEQIARRWPDSEPQMAVSIGAIYRSTGDFDNALRSLDDLVASKGPQTGMRFHYHRGWTLTELQRYEEAVAEFTAGIEDQPDFSWAFLKRACALAQLGKIQEALGDQEQGTKLLREHSDEGPESGAQAYIARADAIVRELKMLLNGQPAASSAPCIGYPTSGGDHVRQRSKFLPLS